MLNRVSPLMRSDLEHKWDKLLVTPLFEANSGFSVRQTLKNTLFGTNNGTPVHFANLPDSGSVILLKMPAFPVPTGSGSACCLSTRSTTPFINRPLHIFRHRRLKMFVLTRNGMIKVEFHTV